VRWVVVGGVALVVLMGAYVAYRRSLAPVPSVGPVSPPGAPPAASVVPGVAAPPSLITVARSGRGHF